MMKTKMGGVKPAGGRMRLGRWVLSAIVCSMAPACVVATDGGEQPGDTGSIDQPLDTLGFYPGRGYMLNNDTVASDCLVPAAYPGDPSLTIVPVQAAKTGGQEVIFSLSKVSSSEEIQNKLNINASASAKFLSAGGSAKFSFAQDTKTDDTSVTLLASVIVRNTSWTVPPGVKLSPDAEGLLKTGSLTRFRERCGDRFLHSYTTGGEFHAFIQVQTSSKEEKEAISASVQGNYLTVSGSAEFNSKMQSIVRNSTTIVRSYQIGGSGIETAPCLDVACVADRVSRFTTAVAANPVIFEAEAAPYGVLKLPTDAISPLDVSVALDVMSQLNSQRNFTRDLLNKFLDVQSRAERYALNAPNATLAEVGTAISTLNTNLTSLENALKACARDLDQCAQPTLGSIAVQPPPAKPASRGLVLIRSYDSPSLYLTGGRFMDPPPNQYCTGEVAQAQANDYRSTLADFAFNIVPGLMPNVGASVAVSFQPAASPNTFLATSNGREVCSSALKLRTGPFTDVALREGTFFIEPGLNGKPNTVSFRRWYDPADPMLNRTAPASTLNSHLYIKHQAGTTGQSIVFYLITDAQSAETKDAASWYLEAL